jgi:lipid-binding SYLF domain-containing protein
MFYMTRRLVVLLVAVCGLLAAQPKAVQRVQEAAAVFDEIMSMADRSIPQELLARAHCVGILPSVKKGGFIFGGRYGKGVMVCRGPEGAGWTGPSTIRVEGGSFGLQIGGTAIDLVLLVMNERGAQKLLQSRFTLGAGATVAAGPVGRDAAAQTDALLRAEILSYSRSRGLFAGINLQGSTLRPDHSDNRQIYGRNVTPKEVLQSEIPPPESAKELIATLNKHSSQRHR